MVYCKQNEGSDRMGTKSTEAKNRYNTKTYDTISIRQPKGWRDKVKDAADKAGKSLAGYIRDAVDKEMRRRES